MKRVVFLMFVMVAVLAFHSCKKMLDPYFDTITTPLSATISIPPIADTLNMDTLGTAVVSYNLDSVVKQYTKDLFSLSSAKSVKVKDMTVTLVNPDSANNLRNFEVLQMNFGTGVNGAPVTIGTATVPDTYAAKTTVPVIKGLSLKDAITDRNMAFALVGRARRATTDTLHVQLTITLQTESNR